MPTRVTVGVAMFLLSAPLAAQELRGTVRDSATGGVIPGAVVMTLDAGGAVVGRSLTSGTGRFRMALDARAARVRIVRIGFAPRELRIPRADTGGAAELDLVMSAVPTMLGALRAVANGSCPDRRDRAAALSLLEQARAGLLATVVARQAHPASIVRLTYERHFEGVTDRVSRQKVVIDSTRGRPVSYGAARPASVFVADGFRETLDGVDVFYGPDAETLLDDDFMRGYCFHLAPPERDRPTQVGLAFRPPRIRATQVDIDGTLWIDTAARALRDVEFRYLQRFGTRHRPGGQIQFREAPNGVVLIDRWALRMVRGGGIATSVRAEVEGFAITESGGVVARAQWSDGHQWRAPLATLRILVDSTGGRPAAGSIVGMTDTDYRAVTDSNGVAEIRYVLPGPYGVWATDAPLAGTDIGLRAAESMEVGSDSLITYRVRQTSSVELTARLCGVSPRPTEDAWLLGRVMLPPDESAQGTQITVRKRVGDRWVTVLNTQTRSDGLFHLCSGQLRDGAMVSVQASRAGQTVDEQIRVSGRVTVVAVPMAR